MSCTSDPDLELLPAPSPPGCTEAAISAPRSSGRRDVAWSTTHSPTKAWPSPSRRGTGLTSGASCHHPCKIWRSPTFLRAASVSVCFWTVADWVSKSKSRWSWKSMKRAGRPGPSRIPRTRSSSPESARTTSGSGRCCRVSRTGMRRFSTGKSSAHVLGLEIFYICQSNFHLVKSHFSKTSAIIALNPQAKFKKKRWKSMKSCFNIIFHRILMDNFDEMAPIIYTPTVGWACSHFSHLYR